MKILRLLIPFFALAVAGTQPSFQPAPALTLPLREGWTLQSSAKVTATGEAISSKSFEIRNWIEADVPTTVVAAQVKNGLLPDPFYGMNLRQYPGVAIPSVSIFRIFRCRRTVPMRSRGGTARISRCPQFMPGKPCG